MTLKWPGWLIVRLKDSAAVRNIATAQTQPSARCSASPRAAQQHRRGQRQRDQDRQQCGQTCHGTRAHSARPLNSATRTQASSDDRAGREDTLERVGRERLDRRRARQCRHRPPFAPPPGAVEPNGR